MKKIAFLLFLFSCLNIWCQKNNTPIQDRVKYTSNEGYNISAPSGAVYDYLGWLWIVGNNADNEEYLFERRQILIQRFDGNTFYTVKLPETTNTIVNAFLFDNGAHGLLVRFDFDKGRSKLYSIDPITQQFVKIENYENIIESYHFFTSYILEGRLTIVHYGNSQVVLLQSDAKKIEIIDTVSIGSHHDFVQHRSLTNEGLYTILSPTKGIHYLVRYDGKFIKKLSDQDFDFIDINSIEEMDRFYYVYQEANIQYFGVVGNTEDLFEFDEINLRFKQVKSSGYDRNLWLHWTHSNNSFLFLLIKKEEGSLFNIRNLSNKSSLEASLYLDDFSKLAYQDLNKEIVLLYNNTLDRILFNQNKIQSYLKGQSIRKVKEISDNLYLVATDNKGIYELNTNTKSTRKIQFLYRGSEVYITEPREIIKTEAGFIFNDKTHLYFVDSNYKILEKYEHPLWLEETFQFGDTIFKGGVHHLGIQRFSVKEKGYHFLSEAIQVREFASNSETLFGVSVQHGLFEYKKGKLTFYVPEEESAENLLSIFHDPLHGILVSTKQGKIYVFDPNSKIFTTFYEDSLGASIVGMISDNSGLLWMNTYAGIVSYNHKTKIANRFTKKDGIFNLEGNRYSCYKDSQGRLFIGSFQGLSVFNPEELSSLERDFELKFTELSYYSKEEKSWKQHCNLNAINNETNIVLPSFNQRFTARVTLAEIANHKNYKYRYRLNNKADDEPSPWSALYLENEIVFSNLSAGEYILEVQVLSSVNQIIGKSLFLHILSEQIFYKTWWFIALVILVLAIIFFYLLHQFKSNQKLYTLNKIAINEARIKEAMMLEIHHRIKNNLQVVSGLLSLQAYNSSNQELKSKLQDSQGRIESIAGIHNILYKSDSREEILVEEYFQDIISYNQTLFSLPIAFALTAEKIILPMDKAIPLALTLNELINNSYKHAFEKEDNAQINISLKKNKKEYKFYYSDNGAFKQNEEDGVSMGMKIIEMMISQLKGELTIIKENNFQLIVRFPIIGD